MIDGNKSLEELENCCWDDIDFDSYVVRTAQAARKKSLSQLTNEEIRLLINQKIGLKYIIPIAVSIINKNPLIETTYFEGDLLIALLELSVSDWENNKSDLQLFQSIVRDNIDAVRSCENIKCDLLNDYLQIVS